jgi:tRNA pseudouridine38-40 synthase
VGRLTGSGREAGSAAPKPGGTGLTASASTTIRFAVEYDGTDFRGFQWQPSVRTVAGTLEAVLSSFLNEPVKITGAGRTDTGVHATGQVVSFSTDRRFPFERLAIALNSSLPSDLTVRDVAIVDENFSARFSARERAYVYTILNRAQPSALLRRYAYHVWQPLDVEAMRRAAIHLVGKRDYRSFCATLPENGITVRTVRLLTVESHGNVIRVEIAADGFLHRMVRTIVGTLVECGMGRRNPDDVPKILDARERNAAGLTAPPNGLYLVGVRYEDGYDSHAEPFSLRAGPANRSR